MLILVDAAMVAVEEAPAVRGFAMRRGRRAKLQAPKPRSSWAKLFQAVARAELMDQGAEAQKFRGRGCYSRTVNPRRGRPRASSQDRRVWDVRGKHAYEIKERRVGSRPVRQHLQEELCDWLDWGDVPADGDWLGEDESGRTSEEPLAKAGQTAPMPPVHRLLTRHKVSRAAINKVSKDFLSADDFSAFQFLAQRATSGFMIRPPSWAWQVWQTKPGDLVLRIRLTS